MMEVIMALIMILFGAFCVFLGGAIASEMPVLYGAEFIFAGFCSLLMVLCGMLCFACVREM